MEYKAGRELDALVAEKVMGCKVEERETFAFSGLIKEWCYYDKEHGWFVVPYFSTSIAAAWQVVERMRERFHIVTLSSDKSLGAREWHFHLANYPYPHDKKNDFDGFGDTAPLAICRTVMEIDDATA